MTLQEFIKEHEFDPQWLTKAAAGQLRSDPLGDLAIEILDEVRREITCMDTSWHDCSLTDSICEIIRRHLKALDQ
jgi:Exoribonuclease II